MNRSKPSLLLFVSSILMSIGLAQPIPAADKAIVRGQVAQPAAPAGDWRIQQQPLPPLQEIVSAPAAEAPVYGLYAFSRAYLLFREQILKVGWPCIRLSGPPFDNESIKGILACAKDKKFYMLTAQVKGSRRNYDSDEAFLGACKQHYARVVDAFGPGGEYCKAVPAFASNPLRFIEIWNEPNYKSMIPDREPRREVEAEREALYGKVLMEAYRVIKSKAPSMQVIGIGAGGGGVVGADRRFIEHLHQRYPELGNCYDILSTHPYVSPAPPEADPNRLKPNRSIADGIAANREILKAAAVGPKPIWYSEMGWTIPQSEGGPYPDGKHGIVPSDFQAAYIVRAYAWALRLGVPHAFIMYVKDENGFNGGFFENQTQKWRPAAHAVKAMIGLMPHPKLIGAITDCDEGSCVYRFQADAQDPSSPETIMAWNVEGPKIAAIPVGEKPVRFVDMLGSEQVLQPSGGSLTVEIGPFPVYVVLPGKPPAR